MKNILLFLASIVSMPIFSQTINDTITNDSIVALQKAAAESSSSSSGSSFLDGLMTLLIIAAALFMIGHMVYILFQAKQFSEQELSVEFFKSYRQEKGMPEESTEDENEKCSDLLDAAFLTWTYTETGEDGQEYRKPNKMKEILTSGKILKEVIEIAPTDPEIIDTLNQYKEVVTSNEARSFDGSKKLVWVGLLVGILFPFIDSTGSYFGAFFSIGMFFIVPTIVYIVSSFTPQFLIDKRADRGGGNVSTGIVAMALGVLGSSVTIRTKYTDGSHEDDHSGHFIALFLGVIMLFIIAFTISIWSVLNYLRNYVLFF